MTQAIHMHRIALKFVIPILAVFLLATSCARGSFSEADIPGKYVSNQKNATETLEIRSDGTFTKSTIILFPQGQAPFMHSGKWELSRGNHDNLLISFDSWSGQGIFLTSFVGSGESLKILIDENQSLYYEKVET